MSKSIIIVCCGLLVAVLGTSGFSADPLIFAHERPTFNKTRDPRPNILPYYLYYAHTEYRREYNRPSYLTGWIADKIATNSQEAMVWRENRREGNYDRMHMPPVYKRYFAPKPWEVLQTGPRPDFARVQPEELKPTDPEP